MNKLTCALVAAVVTGLSVVSPATASAAPDGMAPAKTVVPLLRNYKSCDFVQLDWVAATGYGRGTAYLTTSGDTVTVDFDLNTAVPNTYYDVRIIQTPRPSIGCGPGAPGVATGGFQTDAGGAGRTTVSGPIEANATGAWVMISRPSPYSQTPAEFYTSAFLARI